MTFRVRASDGAGNESLALVDFVVGAATPVPSPGGAPPAPAPPAEPVVLDTAPPPAAAGRPVAPFRPRTINARSLLPRPGGTVRTLRPLLRWRARPGARLYNVQVFRVRRGDLTKVVTAFPRVSRFRVPASRLARGGRYIWRVWPWVGDHYTRRPLGVSYFSVRVSRL